MESHKKVLGICFIILGSFQLVLMMILGTFFTAIFTFAMNQSGVEPNEKEAIGLVMNFLRFLPALIVIFVAIPSIAAGIGVLAKKSWGLVLALIMGCLNIFSFPVGTALGIFTIWVYMEDRKLAKAATNPG